MSGFQRAALSVTLPSSSTDKLQFDTLLIFSIHRRNNCLISSGHDWELDSSRSVWLQGE